MTQTSYPFDTTNTSETQFSQLFKRLNSTGVWGDASTTDLKVFADSSGMQVKAPAGFGLVRGHAYYNDATVTLAIAATTTNPRIDLIVLKLDPVTANSIVLAVKQGTAAASPSDPALTQDESWTGGIYEMPIARVTIPANTSTTITSGMVSDIRPFMGISFGHWTTTLRPSSPIIGQAGLNTSLGYPEVWNGSSWIAFQPDAISAAIITSGTLNSDRLPAVGTAGTYTKVTTDAKGRVTAGEALAATDLPTTGAAGSYTKVTTDAYGRVSSGTTLAASDLPDVPASKIVASEQANITAGKIRAGGAVGGQATTIFVQSGTPTANATGDLWFW